MLDRLIAGRLRLLTLAMIVCATANASADAANPPGVDSEPPPIATPQPPPAPNPPSVPIPQPAPSP